MGCAFTRPLEEINHESKGDVKWPEAGEINSVPFKNERIVVKVTSVYDGDTCTILINRGKDVFDKLNVRVLGIDAPEVNLKGDAKNTPIGKLEMRAGAHVRDKVKPLIEGKECSVVLKKWDKYGGRVVGEIYLPGEEITLSEYLLGKRYAKVYTGKVKKDEWTRQELNYILKNEKN